MEKIIVVTVYNSENSGSFLQAYALGLSLKRSGYDVAYYYREVKGTSHAVRPHIILSLKKMAKLQFKAAIYPWQTWWIYHKSIKMFNICKSNSEFYRQAPKVVIGSDTLWNFKSNYFKKQARIYLGKLFDKKKTITYAVSAADTSTKDFSNTVTSVGGLEQLDAILVRDCHTKNLVSNVTDKDVKIVCDPTLLLIPTDYEEFAKLPCIESKYLLLYYFGEISNEMRKCIVNYATSNCLKIVSIPEERGWADFCKPSSPSNMVTYFKYAECVITNTFHGTAFSMIYEKPFAVHDCNKNKVVELLRMYNETNRLYSKSEEISDLLGIPNVVHSSGIYSRNREDSLKLLINSLK